MRRRVLTTATVVLVALGLSPAAAPHGGGGAAKGYASTISSITPRDGDIEAAILDADDRLQLRVRGDHVVVVKGYEGEPYLRFSPDRRGAQPPLARHLSQRRPLRHGEAPGRRRPEAPPDWETVAPAGRAYDWHDHRIHWMSTSYPPVVIADKSSLTGSSTGPFRGHSTASPSPCTGTSITSPFRGSGSRDGCSSRSSPSYSSPSPSHSCDAARHTAPPTGCRLSPTTERSHDHDSLPRPGARRDTRGGEMSRLVVALVLGSLALAGCGSDTATPEPSPLSGIVQEPNPVVDGETLPDVSHGSTPFSFRAAPNGLLFVYFGYTQCPDVCPTTMSDLRVAIGGLPAAQRRTPRSR